MCLYQKNDFEREKHIPERSTTGDEPYRSGFRRDFARLIHSAAFRRLQGKTQVFPGFESDFFRTRLTHSLEVAQIAKSIAMKINFAHEYFKRNPIDLDLTEFAALAHDLGHPPFGHNGEKALDECMKEVGGFEGNAQSFRIIAKIEKKELRTNGPSPVDQNGTDQRLGLNVTYRSLASIIKYDNVIPMYRSSDKLIKGIYESERVLFDKVKYSVCQDVPSNKEFKTIECSIMDVADDIAYSTYDLEDTFKAEFLDPIKILGSSSVTKKAVADKVSKNLNCQFSEEDVDGIFLTLFGGLGEGISRAHEELSADMLLAYATDIASASRQLTCDGYLRTQFTADLVSEFISGVEIQFDEEHPVLSYVKLNDDVARKVETIKHYTYESTIKASRLRVPEERGFDIIRNLFNKLDSKEGYMLLPSDYRNLYESFRSNDAEKKRVVCDFIAGMTDRYAVEFYSRIFSDSPQSIFKPI